MKVSNLFTTDAPRASRYYYADEILHAEPVGKLLVSGLTWRGDLAPILDAYLETLAPLVNGLTLGRVLHAEEVPDVLDMGIGWLGSFRDKLLAARDERPGGVDVTEVLEHVQRVMREFGGGSRGSAADSLRRFRVAADRVMPRRTGDTFMRHRVVGDFTKPASIPALQASLDKHWAGRAVRATIDRGRFDPGIRPSARTGDSARTAAVRDAVAAAHKATSSRDRIEALNRANKAFWSGDGDPPTVAPSPAQPAANTPDAINEANCRFWAARMAR